MVLKQQTSKKNQQSNENPYRHEVFHGVWQQSREQMPRFSIGWHYLQSISFHKQQQVNKNKDQNSYLGH